MVTLNIELPENFLEEEIRCDYKITSKMKEVWAVELDLLNRLLEVCKKYNIEIMAAGGTLLGAVRHQGFIPWDDDIDMMMMRDQYEKLCEIAKEEFRDPYFFQTEYSDPGTLRGHAQLRNSNTTGALKEELGKFGFNQGIFIDIFVLDRIIDDSLKFEKQKESALRNFRLAQKISRITTRYYEYDKSRLKNGIKRILHNTVGYVLDTFFIEQFFYRRFENIWKKYNNEDTNMCSSLTFAEACPGHFKKREYFKELTELPFEFLKIPVCYRYKELLTQRYGEWEIIQKGTSNHGAVFFDTDVSYKVYNHNDYTK